MAATEPPNASRRRFLPAAPSTGTPELRAPESAHELCRGLLPFQGAGFADRATPKVAARSWGSSR